MADLRQCLASQDGIIVRSISQPTFATKSATSGHLGDKRTLLQQSRLKQRSVEFFIQIRYKSANTNIFSYAKIRLQREQTLNCCLGHLVVPVACAVGNEHNKSWYALGVDMNATLCCFASFVMSTYEDGYWPLPLPHHSALGRKTTKIGQLVEQNVHQVLRIAD